MFEQQSEFWVHAVADAPHAHEPEQQSVAAEHEALAPPHVAQFPEAHSPFAVHEALAPLYAPQASEQQSVAAEQLVPPALQEPP